MGFHKVKHMDLGFHMVFKGSFEILSQPISDEVIIADYSSGYIAVLRQYSLQMYKLSG